MTRAELITRVARAIAEMEGFYVTAEQARARRIPFPTLPQQLANPGSVRKWVRGGKPYPQRKGYVDFVAWARERYPSLGPEELWLFALEEGWRVLHVLVGQYIDGRYTFNKPPTIEEMFRAYAPANENDPVRYARFVASRLGSRPDQRLVDLITGE
jgi:hypothetical protein